LPSVSLQGHGVSLFSNSEKLGRDENIVVIEIKITTTPQPASSNGSGSGASL